MFVHPAHRYPNFVFGSPPPDSMRCRKEFIFSCFLIILYIHKPTLL